MIGDVCDPVPAAPCWPDFCPGCASPPPWRCFSACPARRTKTLRDGRADSARPPAPRKVSADTRTPPPLSGRTDGPAVPVRRSARNRGRRRPPRDAPRRPSPPPPPSTPPQRRRGATSWPWRRRPPREEPRPRDIRLWGSADAYREKQEARDRGHNAYRHDGFRYSAGVKWDWSPDAAVGLSADLLDGRIKSGHEGDARRDDVKGYFLNLYYDGFLKGILPFELKGTYGRIENDVDGHLSFPGHAGTFAWTEEKRKSNAYGLSGKIGLPLITDGGIRLLNSVGFDYRALKSGEYRFDLDGTSYSAPEMKSKSLIIPVEATASVDRIRSWGIVTPRAGAGVVYELFDEGLAARTFNSSVASRVLYDPATRLLADGEYDKKQKMFLKFGVGVDVKTIGGWEMRADYTHVVAEKYRNGAFTLELGKCF